MNLLKQGCLLVGLLVMTSSNAFAIESLSLSGVKGTASKLSCGTSMGQDCRRELAREEQVKIYSWGTRHPDRVYILRGSKNPRMAFVNEKLAAIVETDSNGRFQAILPPGKYHIQSQAFRVKPGRFARKNVTLNPIEVVK